VAFLVALVAIHPPAPTDAPTPLIADESPTNTPNPSLGELAS
jgi:hypothetical protein